MEIVGLAALALDVGAEKTGCEVGDREVVGAVLLLTVCVGGGIRVTI